MFAIRAERDYVVSEEGVREQTTVMTSYVSLVAHAQLCCTVVQAETAVSSTHSVSALFVCGVLHVYGLQALFPASIVYGALAKLYLPSLMVQRVIVIGLFVFVSVNVCVLLTSHGSYGNQT